uniref:alpha/beta hydrolase family protein n=1 Tax=Flavobacterium sp. TaxID=239 RepID=UPI00404B1E05
MKKTLLFLLFSVVMNLQAQKIEGAWHGLLEIPGKPLKVSFNIEKADSEFKATMDIPEQGAKGIPMNYTVFESNKLVMTLEAAGIVFEGTWESDEKILGTFSQGGMQLTLNLFRKEPVIEAAKRPQTPQEPFNYSIEDVVFENTKEKFQLAGTLTTPKNTDFKNVVILISGSGQQNRNSEIFEHKPFWVIADYLTKSNIAVLRFDDRGVGKSGGDVSNVTSLNFVDDVLAAVEYVKSRPELKSKNIILVGHSEGGMIAPLVASKSAAIKALVLLAGPGVSGSVLLKEQSYLIGKASGLTEMQLNKAKENNEKIYDIISKSSNLAEAAKQIEPILAVEYEGFPETQKKQAISQQMATICNPWFQYFVKYDPKPVLEQLKIPVLALNGGKDLQVPADLNIKAIKAAFAKSGNKNLQTKIYPNLNHLFQTAVTGNVPEYATIEETFNETVLTDIINWILNLK